MKCELCNECEGETFETVDLTMCVDCQWACTFFNNNINVVNHDWEATLRRMREKRDYIRSMTGENVTMRAAAVVLAMELNIVALLGRQ